MDPTAALSGLFSLPFLVLCIIIGLSVSGIRKALELVGNKFAEKFEFSDKYEPLIEWAWRETLLPIMPLILGGLFGFLFKDYPYPAPFNSGSATVFIGIIAGLCSGFLYPRVMFYLKKALPKKADEEIAKKAPEFAAKVKVEEMEAKLREQAAEIIPEKEGL